MIALTTMNIEQFPFATFLIWFVLKDLLISAKNPFGRRLLQRGKNSKWWLLRFWRRKEIWKKKENVRSLFQFVWCNEAQPPLLAVSHAIEEMYATSTRVFSADEVWLHSRAS
jgi:hypothetical protein